MKEFPKAQTHVSRRYLPKWLAWAVVSVMLAHFSAVLLSCFGGNYLSDRYWYLVEPYINPLFYQNWKVFAPEPPTQSRAVLFRYRNSSGWSRWFWPGYQHLMELQHNRLSYHSELFDMDEGMADNLYWTLQKPGLRREVPAHTWMAFPAFRVCRDRAQRFAQQRDERADSVQFGLFIEHTIMFGDSIGTSYSFKPFPKIPAR